MARANTCQDQPKKMVRALTLRVALGILKGTARFYVKGRYITQEIRVTERRISSAKVAIVKGPLRATTWYLA